MFFSQLVDQEMCRVKLAMKKSARCHIFLLLVLGSLFFRSFHHNCFVPLTPRSSYTKNLGSYKLLASRKVWLKICLISDLLQTFYKIRAFQFLFRVMWNFSRKKSSKSSPATIDKMTSSHTYLVITIAISVWLKKP